MPVKAVAPLAIVGGVGSQFALAQFDLELSVPDETLTSSQVGLQPAEHALIAKLGRFVPLNDEDREALIHVSRKGQRLTRGT